MSAQPLDPSSHSQAASPLPLPTLCALAASGAARATCQGLSPRPARLRSSSTLSLTGAICCAWTASNAPRGAIASRDPSSAIPSMAPRASSRSSKRHVAGHAAASLRAVQCATPVGASAVSSMKQAKATSSSLTATSAPYRWLLASRRIVASGTAAITPSDAASPTAARLTEIAAAADIVAADTAVVSGTQCSWRICNSCLFVHGVTPDKTYSRVLPHFDPRSPSLRLVRRGCLGAAAGSPQASDRTRLVIA
mmetsp:Transcript_69105/g.189764  ORF Transcript_69105/g.189764 Transcript_69105/m.189764 type:complete len:252 (-) Transcript_69105:396-1151(-)